MSTPKENANLTHDRYVSVITPLSAAVDPETVHFARKSRPRVSRLSSLFITGFVVLMVGMMGFVQQAPAAEAGFWDPLKEFICGNDVHSHKTQKHSAGYRALGIGDPFLQSLGYEKDTEEGSAAAYNAYRHTAYEKYSMSGTMFTSYFGSIDPPKGDTLLPETKVDGEDPRTAMWTCFPVGKIAPTEFSNAMFSANKTLTGVSLWIYGQALNPGWIDDLMDGVSVMITGTPDTGASKGITGFRDGLYFNMMTLVILSSAIYLMFLLFKRQFMQVWTNFLWLAGSLAVGAALMYAPKFLPSLGQGIVTEFTTAMNNTTTGAVLGKVSTDKSKNFCYVGNDAWKLQKATGNDKVGKSTMKNVRTMECSLWSVFVYSPWVAGQFGIPSSSVDSLKFEGGTATALVDVASADRSVNLGGKVSIKDNLALMQIESQSHDAETALLGADEKSKSLKQKKGSFERIADEIIFDQPDIADTWIGDAGLDRISVTSLALISSAFGLVLIVVISGSILMYKVGIILLIAMSPFFLLIGAHAGWGRGITMKWLSMLAGFYLKTAFASMYLGIAMFFYAIITQLQVKEEMSYGVAILAIIVLSLAMLFYRKQFTDTFTNVNIAGSRGSLGTETPNSVRKVGSGVVGAGLGAVGAMGAAKMAGGAAKAAVAANPNNAKLSPAALRAKKTTAAGAARSSAIARGTSRGVMNRMGGMAGMADLMMGKQAGQQVASKHRATAEQHGDQSDPALMARRERENETSDQRYTDDYNAMNDNEEWRESFTQTYGQAPPNPAEYSFHGYGKRFNMKEKQDRLAWERLQPKLRPKNDETPPESSSGSPSGGGTPPTGGGSGGGGGTQTPPKPTPTPSGGGGSPKPTPKPTPTPSGGGGGGTSAPSGSGNTQPLPRPTPPTAPSSRGQEDPSQNIAPKTKPMPPKFAAMNNEALALRYLEEQTPPKGEASTGARSNWEAHQRRIGDQQKKLWSLQDSVGAGNIRRLGHANIVTNNGSRPSRPARPNL